MKTSHSLLRQRIATAVMPHVVNRIEWCAGDTSHFITPERAAQLAVDFADALITELDKKGGNK